MIVGLRASPQAFYRALEDAIERRGVEDVGLSRVVWREGGLFSAQREYLQAVRKDLVFHVCGAPLGNGFFVSWWLGKVEHSMDALPRIGPMIRAVMRPITYYELDNAQMFQSVTHGCVLEVIDGLTKATGLRDLADGERRPIMHEFFVG